MKRPHLRRDRSLLEHGPFHYYTNDRPIRLREYGRNVERMTEFVQQVEDPERRRLLAQETVRVMGTVAPESRDRDDYRKKLWEHLFRMAHGELDVEPPFEINLNPGPPIPANVPYYPHQTAFRQYGRNVELMIEKALEMPDSEARDFYVQQIANIMKQLLLNRDANLPPDDVVIEHLAYMSDGQILLDPDSARLKVLAGPMPAPPPKNKKKKKKKRGGPMMMAPPQPPQPMPGPGPGPGGPKRNRNRNRNRNNRNNRPR